MQEQETKKSYLLWIESSRTFLNAIEPSLSPLHIIIELAENGSQGIMKAAQKSYSCIVFENEMTDVDADDFMRDVREFIPDVQFILLANELTKQEVIKFLRLQISDIIEKKDNPAYLLRTIAKAIQTHKRVKPFSFYHTVSHTASNFEPVFNKNEQISPAKSSVLQQHITDKKNSAVESVSEQTVSDKTRQETAQPSPVLMEENADRSEHGNVLLRESIAFLRDKLRNGQMQLPTMPIVAKDVLSIMGKENIGPHHIIPILERDQHITSKVIKMANTAHNRRVNKIANIHDAIIRVGHKTVFNIVQTVSHRGFFKLKSLAYQEIMENLWENTIATAFISRNIAYGLGIKNHEDVYLAALFINVGEPFLVRVVAGTSEISLKIQNDLQNLTMLFDKCHAEFGSTLLHSWQFNSFHIAAAKHHHDVLSKLEMIHIEPKNEFIKTIHIINIAGFIAQELGYLYFKNPVMNYFPPGLTFQESIHALGISQTSLKEYTNGVETFVSDSLELL